MQGSKRHTDREYEAELAQIRDQLLLMAGRVEEMIAHAVRLAGDSALGVATSDDDVIAGHPTVNLPKDDVKKLDGVVAHHDSNGGGGIIGDSGEDPERPTEAEQAEQLIEIIKQQCGGDEIWVDDESPDAVASIRYYQGSIIVRAPDYVHRMIDGYPFAPVRPRSSAADASEATSGSSRYVTFTSGLSIVQNVKFTAVPVQGAVAGSGTTNP